MDRSWWERTPAERDLEFLRAKRKRYVEKRITRACDRQILASTPEEKEKARLWINAWASLKK